MTVNHKITQRDIPDSIHDAARRLRGAGGEAFIVGGAVRDLLLGRTPGDFDIATNLHPELAAKAFPFSVPTGIQHGTVTVWLNPRGEGQGIEITTYRGEEGYSDGRRPDRVVFKKTIEEDLARRDFTINAIALDPEAMRIVDPYGGQTDLAAGVIKCVGIASERFGEDGLRPVRAVRFAAKLGFLLEDKTKAAITDALDITRKVSIERVHDELVKMLDAPKPSVAFVLMHETGLDALVLPEVRAWPRLDRTEGRWARLASLFYRAEECEAAMKRLRFSNDEREHVVGLVRHRAFDYQASWSDGAVRRYVARVGQRALPDLYDLWRAEERDVEPFMTRVNEVLAISRALKVTDLAIDGETVMRELKIKPSRAVRDHLEALLERVLDEPALNTPEQLIILLRDRAH